MDRKVIIGVGVVIAILIAGYFVFFNQSSSTILPSKPQTYGGDISNLVFSLEELPEGYKIADRTPRTRSDIGEEPLGWGWSEGYYIKYLKGTEESIFDISRIEISNSRYPLENISKTLEGVDYGDYEVEGYTIDALPIPNIGENSKATRFTDSEFGFREYRIEFYKKDIYVKIVSGGATTDYEILKELAQKIEKKI